MLGFVFAIISSLFFSFYVVPRKLSKLSPLAFSFFMAIGFSLSSFVLFLFQPLLHFHETPSLSLLWSVVAGIIWAVSFVGFVKAIDFIGLAKSNQWKNLQGPINAFLSIILLGEFALINPFLTIFAAVAIFLSAICFTIASGQHKHIIQKGILLACLSALGFGTVATIQKYITATTGVYTQQVVWSLSIAASLGVYIFLTKKVYEIAQKPKRELGLGLFAGILYLGASLFQLLSYTYLPASVSFTIIQLNTFWTVLIGIFLFKEITFKSHYKRILLGFALTLLGISLLALARH